MERAQQGSVRFKLEVFEGPLDLLLHLIRVNELDIFDIPIVQITEQYQEYLDLMKEVDIDIGSEFMLMAATLIHIKTKMLLPRHEGEEDPRSELVERLLEHQQYRAAAKMLEDKEHEELKTWKSPPTLMKPFMEVEEELIEVDIFQLMAAFQRVMRSIGQGRAIEIEHQHYSVDDKISSLIALFKIKPRIMFSELMRDCRNKREVVVTFLAILELMLRKSIAVTQARNFSDIIIDFIDTSQGVIEI
jgi:segregation and condensation protein A